MNYKKRDSKLLGCNFLKIDTIKTPKQCSNFFSLSLICSQWQNFFSTKYSLASYSKIYIVFNLYYPEESSSICEPFAENENHLPFVYLR